MGRSYSTQALASASKCSSTPCYRWGDYTSLLIDPNNSATTWAAGSDAPTPTSWGTQLT
jgi:hypothetical protein